MQIFAGVRWKGDVNWKCGSWKWRFSLHSFTVFRTFYIHGHMTAFRWYDCQWPWAHFKVIWLFHINFLTNGVWYGKSYYRQVIGNHTLAFYWCHFWWPWSTFEGHFSLGCHFHVAELLVFYGPLCKKKKLDHCVLWLMACGVTNSGDCNENQRIRRRPARYFRVLCDPLQPVAVISHT